MSMTRHVSSSSSISCISCIPSSTALNGVHWKRSSHSTGANNCLETSGLADGRLAVRDSKHADGPALLFSAAAWGAFVAGVKCGEF